MAEASPYDAIAEMYNALWFDWYLPACLPALEKLFFSLVPAPSPVLDVCCGAGHVTKELVKRGYQVLGVDQSSELVRLARHALPAAEFSVQDVCTLTVGKPYAAALSTFDSFNHILSLTDLKRAFGSVCNALESGGRFVFDMNLEEAYSLDLKQWSVEVHDNSVGLVRGIYDAASKQAQTELIWFSRAKENAEYWWQRRSVVEQKCYERDEILKALAAAGFESIRAYMASELDVDPALGHGRMFVSARACG